MDLKNLPDLNNFEVSGENLDPLAFDSSFYASIDDVVARLSIKQKKTKIIIPELQKNGIVRRDSFETYLANSANSSSQLKQILITPRHYQVYKEEILPKKTKSYFEFGTFCHMAFLEPKKFASLVIEKGFSKTKIESQREALEFYLKLVSTRKMKKYDDFLLQNDINLVKLEDLKRTVEFVSELTGKTFVDLETYNQIKLVEENYHAYGDGIIPKLLKGAAFETSFYGVDEETKIPVRVRPDAFNIAENIGVNTVISLKTTSADNLQKFWTDTGKYCYELSEAMYLKVISDITGRTFNGVLTIMLQSKAPFLPAVFWWNPDDLNLGLVKYKNALKTLRSCLKKGLKHWQGYDYLSKKKGLLEASLPSSSYNNLNQILNYDTD